MDGSELEGRRATLVDGHVHLHPIFPREVFLNRAHANLEAAARRFGFHPGVAGVLMLTEVHGVEEFERLAAAAGRKSFGPWKIEELGDGRSLLARAGPRRLVLVAGQQVATVEGLEVLALGTRARFADGLGLRETVEAVLREDAAAVIPWGFGKWWLQKGEHVRDLLNDTAPDGLLLGDNGGRPARAPTPHLFRRARALGIPLLAGSDPLPFPSEVKRVGSYGSVLDLALDAERPAAQLCDHLRGLRDHPPTFGRGARLPSFIVRQAKMNWKKRFAT